MEADYGFCVGVVLDGLVLSSSHSYSDGKVHELGSSGLCTRCLFIRKEYLQQKEVELIKSFDEKDFSELELLTSQMYEVGKWE